MNLHREAQTGGVIEIWTVKRVATVALAAICFALAGASLAWLVHLGWQNGYVQGGKFHTITWTRQADPLGYWTFMVVLASAAAFLFWGAAAALYSRRARGIIVPMAERWFFHVRPGIRRLAFLVAGFIALAIVLRVLA